MIWKVSSRCRKAELLRNALKLRAEEAKVQLSFSDRYELLTEPTELGEDETVKK